MEVWREGGEYGRSNLEAPKGETERRRGCSCASWLSAVLVMVVLLGIMYASLLAASISFRAVLVEKAILANILDFFLPFALLERNWP